MKIIIQNNNTQVMLAAVDSVLEKFGRDEVPEHIKGQVTLSALKNMFEDNHFSVCKVKELAKQNDVHISSEHMQMFSSLHCVAWNEMHEQTREYVFAILIEYFRGNVVMANSYGDTNK